MATGMPKHVFKWGEPVLPITIATGRPGCFNQLLVSWGGTGLGEELQPKKSVPFWFY